MDLNKYTDEDIMQAIALHLMTTSRIYKQLDDETRNVPYLQYYFGKLKELRLDMSEDLQKAIIASNNEASEALKFVMGDDGLTEV